MERYNDDELVYLYRQGCEEALEVLVDKYKKIIRYLVNHTSSHYSFNLGNREDVYQSLLITFYQQIDAYREDQSTMFATFMSVVLERRFNSIARDYYKHVYRVEKEKISFEEPIFNDDVKYPLTVSEVIADYRYEYRPEMQLYVREKMNTINQLVDEKATEFERIVFDKIHQGYSPKDIAEELKCPIRSVRNAFYRVNHKIKVKKT